VGSEYLFGDFLRLSAFSFNAPPAKFVAVLRRVALAGTMQGRLWRAFLTYKQIVIMPNIAQTIVPNNSQSDMGFMRKSRAVAVRLSQSGYF